MNFICIIIKNHFHINGFALSLALKASFLELGNDLLVDLHANLNSHMVSPMDFFAMFTGFMIEVKLKFINESFALRVVHM